MWNSGQNRQMAQERQVFYWATREDRHCRWNGGSGYLADDRLITNGGICAYQEDLDKVFICIAPDQKCWSLRENCLGPFDEYYLTPGEDQQLCTNFNPTTNPEDQIWCCSKETLCPRDPTTWIICQAAWDNPLAGMEPQAALSFVSSVLGTTSVGTTTVLGNNPIFSTTTAPLIDITSTSIESIASNATSLASSEPTFSISLTRNGSATAINTGTDVGGSSTSFSASASSGTAAGIDQETVSQKSQGLSGGAIAGIVVGCVAALVIATALFFYYRRRRKSTMSKDDATVEVSQNAFAAPNQEWVQRELSSNAEDPRFPKQRAELMT